MRKSSRSRIPVGFPHRERDAGAVPSLQSWISFKSYPLGRRKEPPGWTECRVPRYYFTLVILVFSGWECGDDFHQWICWVGLSSDQSHPRRCFCSPALVVTHELNYWYWYTYICALLSAFVCFRLTLTCCREELVQYELSSNVTRFDIKRIKYTLLDYRSTLHESLCTVGENMHIFNVLIWIWRMSNRLLLCKQWSACSSLDYDNKTKQDLPCFFFFNWSCS